MRLPIVNLDIICKSRPKTYVIRNSLLSAIEKVDASFGKFLHHSPTIRPYALKRPIYNKELLTVKISFLNNEITKKFVECLLSAGNLDLQGETATVSQISIEVYDVKPLEVKDSFKVAFKTPTFFKIAGRDFPLRFPLPNHFFLNLTRIWNSFLEPKMDENDIYEFVSKNIFVSSFKVNTSEWDIGKERKVAGCVGWVKYVIFGEEHKKEIEYLLSLAQHSNVGNNRTTGCGVVKVFA